MKRISSLLFISLLSLTGCQTSKENKTDGKIIFSEFLVSEDLSNYITYQILILS